MLEGSYASYYCSVSSSGTLIYWYVNGSHYHFLPIKYDARIISGPKVNGTGRESNFTMLALKEANNSQIQCSVLSLFTNTENYSIPIRLIIHGIPLPPTDLEVNVISDKLIIYWHPPFKK